MTPHAKYVLLQVPGWVAAAILLVWLWPRTDWSPWVAAGLWAAYVGKDFALWPWLRPGYEAPPPTGTAGLIGARGVARGELAPRGWIRLGGELWQAEVRCGSAPIPAGTEVRVDHADGRTLIVSPAGEGDTRPDPS